MEWLPYLTQLSRRPAALKYTGIYPMLPNEIQQFLDSCSYQAKKDTLRILAKLTEKSSFSQATEAVRAVIVHNARDVDSVVAVSYTHLDVYKRQADIRAYMPHSLSSMLISNEV